MSHRNIPMRMFRRLAVCLVVALGIASVASEVTSSAADVAHGDPLVAYSSTTVPHPTRAAATSPTPSTTTAPPAVAPPATVTPAPVTTVPPPAAPVAAKAPAPARAVTVAPAAAPAPAPAPTTPDQVGAAALALIDYPWQRLGYGLTFTGPSTGFLGKANCSTHQITIFVRPTQTIRQVAFVIAFELGHAIDCGTMTDAKRAEWAAIRGFPAGWTWFPSCTCTEDNFGSGDISMVFASWLVPNGGYGWRSNLAGPPGASMAQLVPYLTVG